MKVITYDRLYNSHYISHFFERIQHSYQFSDLEMAKMKYTLKGIGSELIKTLLLSLLFLKLNHFSGFAGALIMLVIIRSRSGGLHMEHFISCLLFTLVFMLLAVIVLPAYIPVPYFLKPLILLPCIVITYWCAPIQSKKRPPASQETILRYRNQSVIFIFICSTIILIMKTTPFADICFWIIVLQTLQLACAKIAQKGGTYEKAQ